MHTNISGRIRHEFDQSARRPGPPRRQSRSRSDPALAPVQGTQFTHPCARLLRNWKSATLSCKPGAWWSDSTVKKKKSQLGESSKMAVLITDTFHIWKPLCGVTADII